MPLCRYAVMPLRSYTIMPLRRYAVSPLYPYAFVPLNRNAMLFFRNILPYFTMLHTIKEIDTESYSHPDNKP